jgi:hypothetical protein
LRRDFFRSIAGLAGGERLLDRGRHRGAADIPLGIASTPQGFSRRAREGRRFIRSVGTYTLMPSLNFLQK